MHSFSPINVGVISLGCPKNTADTESVLSLLPPEANLCPLPEAELVILNTCGFLKSARDEAYATLDQLAGRKVILMGCMARMFTRDHFKTHPQLFAVVSGKHYPRFASIISSVARGERVYAVSDEPDRFTDIAGKTVITPRSYAYIKIAEGCNNGCSFCFIPSLKGRFRSRPMESILEEARDLVAMGVKELILVCQDSGYYGADLYKEFALYRLLKELNAIPGEFWIRVMYIYLERIDDRLLQTMEECPKVCPYFDIPLQHGDPEILKLMRRPHQVERVLQNIQRIRSYFPKAAMRTGFIVGFPGETDIHFKHLLVFVRKIRFDNVGVFTYSREEGTPSYHLPHQVEESVKQARRHKLMMAQQKIVARINAGLEGEVFSVLLEGYDSAKKLYFGRSARYAPNVDGLVWVSSKKQLSVNVFYKVKIGKTDSYDLYGKIVG